MNCNAVLVKFASLKVTNCMKLMYLMSFVISVHHFYRRVAAEEVQNLWSGVWVERSLWWEIISIIEAMWAPTLGPSLSVELYRFRCFCDSDLWTWPRCYRVHQVAGDVCIGLAARLPISPHPIHIPVEMASDWASGLGVNLTWGFHTQTTVTALPSSVFPGTSSQMAACLNEFTKTVLPPWLFFKMYSHEDGFVSSCTFISYPYCGYIYCLMTLCSKNCLMLTTGSDLKEATLTCGPSFWWGMRQNT
jgi:hypothetical protein